MDKLQPTRKGVEQQQLIDPKKGIKDPSGNIRGTETAPKPTGTLSAAKNPLLYIGRCLSHLFSRIGDFGHSELENIARHTERTLSDPFASSDQKEKAYQDLLSALGKKITVSGPEAVNVTDKTVTIINRLTENDPEKAASLAVKLSESGTLLKSESNTRTQRNLFRLVAQHGTLKDLDTFVTGLNRKDYSRWEPPIKDIILDEIKKDDSPVSQDKKVAMAKKLLLGHIPYSGELKSKDQNLLLNVVFQGTDSKASEIFLELMDNAQGVSRWHGFANDNNLVQVGANKIREDITAFGLKLLEKMPLEQKAEFAYAIASVNKKFPNQKNFSWEKYKNSVYSDTNRISPPEKYKPLWSGDSSAQTLLNAAFSPINAEAGAGTKAFNQLMDTCGDGDKCSLRTAAINMLAPKSTLLSAEQKEDLAIHLANNRENLTRAQEVSLLKSGCLPKDKAVISLKALCTSCYASSSTNIDVSTAHIENIIDGYLGLSTQLDETERTALLKGSLLPLIKRAEAQGKKPEKISTESIKGRAQLAKDLTRFAGNISTQANNASSEIKAMEALLHLATHNGPSRTLSHTQDLEFHLALAKNANQSNEVKQQAASQAANQLKSIERESMGGDGLIKYVEVQKASIQKEAQTFLDNNKGLSESLKALLDASSSNPKEVDFGPLDTLLGSLTGYDDDK